MLSNYQTSITVSLSILCLFSLLWLVQPLALVIFLSLLLTLLLNPIVNQLTTKRIPRSLASLLTLITFLALVIWLFVSISKTFLPTFANFLINLPNIAEHLPLLDLPPAIAAQISESFSHFASFSVTALQSSMGIILSFFNKILDLIITIFVTFYLLKDGRAIEEYLATLFPVQDKQRIIKLFDTLVAALTSYIRGQLTICVITGILVFAYFSIFNLSYASVFAVLSAVGEFVPVVGPTIASLSGSLLATTVTPALGLQTLGFYLLLTQINHNIIYPYLIGKSLNLHPIAIMLSIMLGGQLLGAVGMFLAVPCMVILKIVLEDLFHHRAASIKTK